MSLFSKKKFIALSLASALTLSGCEKTIPLISDIFDPSNNTWSLEFAHDRKGRLDAVIEYIGLYAKQPEKSQELDQLLYYLRTYNYFAADIELTDEQSEKLNRALHETSRSNSFYSNDEQGLRLQENYLVALYLYFSNKKLHARVLEHRPNLIRILQQFSEVEALTISEQAQYTLWEAFRAAAFLGYEARRNEEMQKSLTADKKLADTLIAITRHQKQNNWIFQHGIWSTAYIQNVSEDKDAEAIDEQMMRIFDNASFLSENEKKFAFSNRYLVNSYRVQDDCLGSFKDRCVIPTIDEALPINHKCSDSLFIRANQMTPEQLTVSCTKLTSQESFFHELLDTKNEPTGDDFNTSLRVVIFDNYSQYNQYGSLTFNIHTNNGGMYIEGDPSKKGNQATFYSFEAFWERPEFSVWNLNHEYIHYLDGRFVKYGAFGHFPSKLVWWSEGLAEYVSKGDHNPSAFKLLKDTPLEEWPTLEQEFATTYQDGLDRTYKWSYQAIRFLAENDKQNFRELARHLKQNDFESYEKLLSELAQKHQPTFLKWQQQHLATYKPEPKAKREKPRGLYRYLYRDYLMPKEIKYGQKHRHIDA
ncbi:MAG: collagenase [Kangiellaceae bacterium]|nr:collagenase [Kangiellaceae bacterium]